MNEIQLKRAIDGFLLHKQAEQKSGHTIRNYRNNLGKLSDFIGDVPLRSVGINDLRRFFAHLRSDYTTIPDGCAPRPRQTLSEKTIRNIHTTISSFYTWAIAEKLVRTNPMRKIARPKGDPPPIVPFTMEEMAAMVRATKESRAWHNKPTTVHKRPTAARDQAIILTLLDTGLRASELCHLTLGDLDQSTGHIVVLHGKGNKSRTVRADRSTVRAIWRYLVTRPDDVEDDAPLFAIRDRDGYERPMTRYSLRLMLKRIGERAGVRDVYPHRFRHTFAIEYLRNGGDIYTLQRILGHSTLEMVRRYLAIAQTDLDAKHKVASPVRNWRL